jgi:alpha-tubulin suppressor-like RCC1 family protein
MALAAAMASATVMHPRNIGTAITAGGAHSCALTASGGIKCWGENEYGQLGDGTRHDRHKPVDVNGPPGIIAAVAGGQGGGHTCALSEAGGVACWGYNAWGQIGDGTTRTRSTPVAVSMLGTDNTATAAGASHSCALKGAGGVACWGYNYDGELGNGTTQDQHTPVKVRGLKGGVIAIATGASHTCALTETGGVKCWGRNEYGQIGDGTTVDRLTPVNVKGLRIGVIAIAAGGAHTCALTEAGDVKCWGDNRYGQLGDGTMAGQLRPVAVRKLGERVDAVALGGAASCALMHSGGVMCRGFNKDGELGDGTQVTRPTPGAVVDLDDVAAIAVGFDHACALTRAAGIKCWGFNVFGQVGDGSTMERLAPVSVKGF